MRNFQVTFETSMRSFIGAFSICMNVPLNSSTDKKYKYGHLCRWYIKLLFLRGAKTETNFPKK